MRLHALFPPLFAAALAFGAESPAEVVPDSIITAPAPAAPSPVTGAAPAPAAPPAKASPSPGDLWSKQNRIGIIENVDGRIITTYDVRKLISPNIDAMNARIASITDPEQRELEAMRLLNMAREGALQELTNRMLTLSDLEGRKAKLPPSFIAERIDEHIINEFHGDRAEYLRNLRARGLTPREDREDMEERILLSLAQQETRKSISEISPAKLEAYYRDNALEFERKAAIRFSQISLLPGAADTDADTRKLAADIRARLDKGEAFEALAKKYSGDSLAESGGKGEWRELSGIDNRIAAAITPLKIGETCAPLEIEAGGRVSIFILRRDDYRAAGPVPISEVRRFIENKLFDQSVTIALADRMVRLREKYYIRRYEP